MPNSQLIRQISRHKITIILFALAFSWLASKPVLAQNTEGASLNDPVEVETFFDELIASHLQDYHIAGAAVSVVQDGEIRFTKGYGYADVENNVAVSPETTLFRLGSLTKLFTWTALMQLYEQGKVALDADINTYLTDFQIPNTFDEPITISHLMGHTTGFEDRVIGLAARDAAGLIPIGEWLEINMPARIRPPGELIAYSNYGTTLAGYIIEQVSGMPYEQYIEENILQPLQMSNSTVRQTLSADMLANLSHGYVYAGDRYVARDFEFLQVVPAGAMSASALDIAHFMLAHLQDGEFNGNRILETETAQLMHSTIFTHDPRVNGFAHGFMEMSKNQERIIGHSGDTQLFFSVMALLPEEQVGVFVSYNSVGGRALNLGKFLQQFMDHYYPATIETPAALPDFAANPNPFTGSYRMTRTAYTTGEKVLGLLSSITISARNEVLVLQSPLGTQEFVQTAPLYFQEVNGFDRLVFLENEQGEVTHASLSSVPTIALEKVAWYQAPSFHMMLLLFGLVMFMSLIIVAPINFILQRRRTNRPPQARLAAIAPWLAGIAALLNILFVVLIATADQGAFAVGDTTMLLLPSGLAFIAALLTIPIIFFAVLAWLKAYWTLLARIHYSLITLGLILFAWSLFYWNLFTFQF